MSKGKYWDNRASREYTYKGEKFYTITAIPYYYRRRRIILKNIEKLIQENYKICDFGCGDGEYIKYFSKKCRSCSFHGVDISEDMVNIAKTRNDDKKTWEISSDGIHSSQQFDLIYSSAVFAHISDADVKKLFTNIYEHTKLNGKFVICEQVAPYRYEGGTYIRRPLNEYVELLQKAGFKKFEYFIIDFWFHRIVFERRIGKYLVNKHLKYNVDVDKQLVMLDLNKNKIYKFFSTICAILSIPRVFKNSKNGWGYCFIVAKL